MNLQLSIIVPVYNVEKYLQRCMESLLTQNISNYEIILVDDGSKDKSSEICDEYASKYSFVRVIHKENEGLGYARNSGLAVAKGKYVSFVDSDDTVSSEHFRELLRVAEKYHADACLGGMTDVYETHKVISRHPLREVYLINKKLWKYCFQVCWDTMNMGKTILECLFVLEYFVAK